MSFWGDIRKAMQQAIVAASGFSPEKVLWASQNSYQPKGDYIDLSLSGFINAGQDGIIQGYEPAAPNGQQITQQVIGQREVTLTVEVFTDTLASNEQRNAVLPGDDALAVVDAIRSAFMFDTIRDPPAALGISFFDLSATAEYVPQIASTGFRGRAVWPIRCWVPAPPARQRTTFIETVEGRITASGGAGDPIVRDFTATPPES